MGQRIRNISAILLKCAICNLVCAGQHMAIGAEMAMPPKLVSGLGGKPVLVATASQAAEGDVMAVQQTRSADTPAAPATSELERKSTSPLPGHKQRRRKPRMVNVPTGAQAVAQVIEEPDAQAVVQEARKPDTPGRPQITVQKTEGAEAGDPFAPAKPKVTAQKTEGAEADDPFAPVKPQATQKKKTGGKQYRMAPIRWRASVSEVVSWLHQSRSFSGAKGTTSSYLEHTQTADINLSSYIIQPYIASVSGGIGVVSSAYTGGGSFGGDNKRRNNLYGNGRLSLFSRSRFPFSMLFNSTTANQTRSLLPNDNLKGRTLSLFQEYRPLGANSKYRGNYSREDNTSTSSGNSSATSFTGSYNTAFGGQPFDAHVVRTARAQQGVKSSSMNTLSARHIYLPPDSLLALSNSASLVSTSQDNMSNTLAATSRYKAQIMQASSIAEWQPESEDIPLLVTGGLRLYRMQTTTDGVSVPVTQSLGGSVLANYTASPNLTYSADGSAAYASLRGTSNVVTTQSGRASYQSNPAKVANATYTWSGSGGVRNQTGLNPDSSVFGSAGHALAGNYSPGLLGKQLRMRYGVNQSVGIATSRVSGQKGILVNGGFLGWSSPSNEMVTAGVGLSVTDTRTFGKDAGRTMSVLLSFGGIGQKGYGYGYKASVYGVKIEADASLAASYSQQRDSAGSKSGGMQISPSAKGRATYQKGNVFGVRKLVYSGILRSDVLPKPSYYGPVVWRPVQYDLSQILSYRIGMNEARIVGNLSEEHNGLKNASLFIQFMAWRSIGN